MPNIEEVHCTAAINAVVAAHLQLMHHTAEEALQTIPHRTADKLDTLGLDGIPESAIANSLMEFDPSAVLITEEVGSTNSSWLRDRYSNLPPTIYVSDPTDRSYQLKTFLSSQDRRDRRRKIGDIVQASSSREKWEAHFGSPASITGATSAIACIRRGIPVCSVFVNFITQELFVAFRAGVFRLTLPHFKALKPSKITLDHIRQKGKPIFFRKFADTGSRIENMKSFATFLGKTVYPENLNDSGLLPEDVAKRCIHYDEPGGPSRVLYLSTIQPEKLPIGFILANGEKIGEWIHWLPFVRFGKSDGEPEKHALNLYEIYQSRPWTKEGILMSTPPHYSVFCKPEEYGGKMAIDIDRLRSFDNPSRLRSTLLVAPTTNSWAITTMTTHNFRQIMFVD